MKVGKIITKYKETQPQYNQVPFFNKMEELEKSYPKLFSLKVSEINDNSWFSILWRQINCTPNLQLTTQFTVYYKLSGVLGFERIGLKSHKIKECEFWKDVLRHDESVKIIAEEEKNIEKFLSTGKDA